MNVWINMTIKNNNFDAKTTAIPQCNCNANISDFNCKIMIIFFFGYMQPSS